MRELRSVSLVVQNSWYYVDATSRDLLALLDRPVVKLPLPYGWEGTRRWLDAVTTAAQGEPVELVANAPDLRPAYEEFDRLRLRLAGRRIAVVTPLRHAAHQLAAEQRYGVALLEVLRELGLGGTGAVVRRPRG